jgi:POLQ-like helicase
MRPEARSRALFGMTRSKGKMYEFDLPETAHINIPSGSVPADLFVLTIATLGDVAASIGESANIDGLTTSDDPESLEFSARFFDAFIASRLETALDQKASLLASAAYYLARLPGSSTVLAERTSPPENSPVDRLLHWTLLAKWVDILSAAHPVFGERLEAVARGAALHFTSGADPADLVRSLRELRDIAYRRGSPSDLLQVDVLTAVLTIRLANSAWVMLPRFSGIAMDKWAPAIGRPAFPKELWPSQMLLGRDGLFSGASGVVQMPTSAGKTRSVEMVLRSAFLAERATLAVVVAPFRALCHEIGTALRRAFRDDAVTINELSDALQRDFLDAVHELLEDDTSTTRSILVLTPEKLLYVLRQVPDLVNHIGIVVYDEGHQFDSGTRGITYELLLTEIKEVLPEGAQTILLSGVMPNAASIGAWLIGENARVVGGSGLLPTARSVAFASWQDRLGRLEFFESASYDRPDFFVPRVIEQLPLLKRPRERTNRVFPEKNNASDVALYLGLRLVTKGAVAVFCGRKSTASKLAERAVEVYAREVSLSAPSAVSDPQEMLRLGRLAERHFGSNAALTRAAQLGVFVHHGATPHGIRLAIEHAMQTNQARFVVCTSTLAQGVNLPIRYLIVSGIHQAGTRIKVRDFQNLMGRAGRSGMHTEGLIIFSDAQVYDTRRIRKDGWKFRASVQLLKPEQSESITSSLLEVISPIALQSSKNELRVPSPELCEVLLSDKATRVSWADDVAKRYALPDDDRRAILDALGYRRHLVSALESYLMANRGIAPFAEFRDAARLLASKTLAFHLGSADERDALGNLFSAVAEYVELSEPSVAKQAVFAKTLLGVDNAKVIDAWVIANRDSLLAADTNQRWLDAIWPLWRQLLGDSLLNTILPLDLPALIAHDWLRGEPYYAILQRVAAVNGSKPWGSKRSPLTLDDIVGLCDDTFGFDCALIVAAIGEFLFGETSQTNSDAESLLRFQKALKYGVPDLLSTSCYEAGFADRVVAQTLSAAVRSVGFDGANFPAAIGEHRQTIENEILAWPSYYHTVLASRR